MKYKIFPGTDIKVSQICLGTMTWGEQNSETEAHEQLDYALEKGINFIDTAELYAVPISPETFGKTEEYIGNWLKSRTNREKLFIATKAAGPGREHIREGKANFGEAHLNEALQGSLERLQTNYVNLYQLHWPERRVNNFGRLNYVHRDEDSVTNFKKTLEVLARFVQDGKVKYIGISNETPWGMMQYLNLAREFDLPLIRTIQNPYSLLNRTFDIGLSEISIRENIGLLAYSPLAAGILSGKYLNGQKPKGARYTEYPHYFPRYSHPNTMLATEEYAALAEEYNLSLTQMALAFVHRQKFLTATIIGATNMQQLEENIASIGIDLSEELIKKIETIHLKYPNPAP